MMNSAENAGQPPEHPAVCRLAQLRQGAREFYVAEGMAESIEAAAGNLAAGGSVDAATSTAGHSPSGLNPFRSQRPAYTEQGMTEKNTAWCETCNALLRHYLDGAIEVKAGACAVSGGCELSWAEQHARLYGPGAEFSPNRPEKPAPILAVVPCGEEEGCNAVIRIFGKDGKRLHPPRVINGRCAVRKQGNGWKKRGEEAWRRPHDVVYPSQQDELGATDWGYDPSADGIAVTRDDIISMERRVGIRPESSYTPDER